MAMGEKAATHDRSAARLVTGRAIMAAPVYQPLEPGEGAAVAEEGPREEEEGGEGEVTAAEVFATIAARGSLTGAAEALGMSRPMVTRVTTRPCCPLARAAAG